jgi:hypothetical protein
MPESYPTRFLPFLALFCLGLCGCSSGTDTGHAAPGNDGQYKSFCELPVACQEITQACHPKDTGAKSQIHDCHLTGHTVGTLAACSKDRGLCLQVCGDAPPLSDGAVEDLGASCRDH